jgi:hypothetical protein
MKATAPEVIKQAPAGCIQAVAPAANSARRMWGIVRLAAIKTSTVLGTGMGLPEGCGRKDQLLDADGSAMVVHAAADNYAQQPGSLPLPRRRRVRSRPDHPVGWDSGDGIAWGGSGGGAELTGRISSAGMSYQGTRGGCNREEVPSEPPSGGVSSPGL